MGLAFKKKSVYLIGSATTPLTLTGNYQAGSPFFVGEAEQIGLDIAYTMGTAETGNSLILKVEFSGDEGATAPTNWYQEVTEAPSSGVITLSLATRVFASTQSAGTYDYLHDSIPLDAKWIRLSVYEDGITTNGGSVTILGTTTIT